MPKLVKSTLNIEGRVTEQYAVVDGKELRPWDQDEELGIVGYPVPRIDGAARATGEARYTYDVQLAGMTYAHVLRAPHPKARITQVNVSHATALPGVLGIMTCVDAPHLLSPDVRFAGQPIAVVVATDPAIAEDALRSVDVEYDTAPFVCNPEAALDACAPSVHDGQSNVFGDKAQTYSRGDVEAGFAQADVVVELDVRTPTALHHALETHGCVAHWEGDQLTIYESTQHAFGVRKFAATTLDLPLTKVRAIGTFVGGGFGAKLPGHSYTIIAASLAKRIRRPVHLMYDRQGESLQTGNRGRSVQRVKLGATRDGAITAIQLDAITEGGAAIRWIPALAGPFQLMYHCANVHTEVKSVLTNLGPMSAFRAPGFVEGMVGLEAAMDELAVKLQIDPLALRQRNIPSRDQLEDKPFSSFPLDECYMRGAQAIGWERRAQLAQQTGRYRRGIGMSSQMWWGGGGPPAYAEMLLNADGTATVMTGTQDIGTGTRTILAQVAAEEVGLALGSINVTVGDTLQGPFGPESAGSITTGSMAPTVRAAAHDLRMQLSEVIAQMHDVPEDEVEIRGGVAYRRDDQLTTIDALMHKLGNVMLIGTGSRGPNPDDVSVVTSGAQFAEVEVDTVTGRVRVIKMVAAHDSGRVLNPQTYNSQIYGGMLQGLGFALMEQRVVDEERGVVLNPNLEWYKLPTAADTPVMHNILMDIPDTRANSTGAKGAGEPGIIPTAAAIANAVAHAVGVRVTELPITPARVLEALERR